MTDFSTQVEAFTAWLDALAFNTGDGPHALFTASVDYLRRHQVVLPGVSTLARLIARVREEATARLHRSLCADLTATQRARLDELLVVAEGERVCELERWRKGVSVPSGKNLEKALKRAGEITGSGLPTLVRNAAVPRRRLLDLARVGMAAKSTALRRQAGTKRWATVAATVAYLRGKAVDDALGRGPGETLSRPDAEAWPSVPPVTCPPI